MSKIFSISGLIFVLGVLFSSNSYATGSCTGEPDGPTATPWVSTPTFSLQAASTTVFNGEDIEMQWVLPTEFLVSDANDLTTETVHVRVFVNSDFDNPFIEYPGLPRVC